MTQLPEVRVLGKVHSILAAFSRADPTLTMREIVERTALPASTCQRLVQSLLGEGLLYRYEDQYRIGLTTVRWASPGVLGLPLVQALRQTLHQLRDVTTETAHLRVRAGNSLLVVATAQSNKPVVPVVLIGEASPVPESGRIFAAYDSAALLLWTAPREDPHRDILELERIRQDGYDLDESGSHIEAPVFGADGSLVSTIGISVLGHEGDLDQLCEAVKVHSREASELLNAAAAG